MANESTRTPAEQKAWAKAVDEQLVKATTELDQLAEQVDNDGLGVKRETTENLLDVMRRIQILHEEAQGTGNKSLANRAQRQWDRARDVAGFTPRRNRRLT